MTLFQLNLMRRKVRPRVTNFRNHSLTNAVVTLGIGQRTDVLVTGLSNGTGEYWMRSNLSDCSLKTNGAATAVVYYLHEDLTKEPTTQPWPAWVNSVENICANVSPQLQALLRTTKC